MVFLCSCQSLEVVLNHQTASGKGSLLALSRCWSWHSMQSLELRCTRTYCDQERSSDWFTDFVRSLRQKGSEGWMPKLCAWEAFHAVNCCTAGSPTQINSCQSGGQEDCSLSSSSYIFGVCRFWHFCWPLPLHWWLLVTLRLQDFASHLYGLARLLAFLLLKGLTSQRYCESQQTGWAKLSTYERSELRVPGQRLFNGHQQLANG